MGVPNNGLKFMALDKTLASMFISLWFCDEQCETDLQTSKWVKDFLLDRCLYKYEVITFDNKIQIFGLFICLFINFNWHIQLLLETIN